MVLFIPIIYSRIVLYIQIFTKNKIIVIKLV